MALLIVTEEFKGFLRTGEVLKGWMRISQESSGRIREEESFGKAHPWDILVSAMNYVESNPKTKLIDAAIRKFRIFLSRMIMSFIMRDK